MKPYGYVRADGQGIFIYGEHQFQNTQDAELIPIYTTPPQRTWVGLTRAERFEIEKAMSKYYDYQHECKTVCLPEFAAAIEAKLKEKNT